MSEYTTMSFSKDNNNIRLFALNSNKDLAEKVSDLIGVPLSSCSAERFADGEVHIDIQDSIRNDIIFVIQSTSKPVNENLMELLIFIDALKRASAKEINIVMPYYGYSRQDRKAKSRQPISAKLVANLVERAGADRVITLDLHASQIQGFFDIPTDHLTATKAVEKHLKTILDIDTDEIVVVSPDHGGVKRARKLAKALGDCGIAIIDKKRPRPNEAEVEYIIGDVEGKIAIMYDDMVDTAGTLTLGADKLLSFGATKVIACCIHGILSHPALERIEKSDISKLIITDSIQQPKFETNKIEVISVDEILAKAIKNIYEGKSMKDLFGGN